MFSHTYAVLLDESPRRLVHSINVAFDDEDFCEQSERPEGQVEARFDLQQPVAPQEANRDHQAPRAGSAAESLIDNDVQQNGSNPLYQMQQPYVSIEPISFPQNASLDLVEEYFDAEDPYMQKLHLAGDQWGAPGNTSRPAYHGMCNVNELTLVEQSARSLVMGVISLKPYQDSRSMLEGNAECS